MVGQSVISTTFLLSTKPLLSSPSRRRPSFPPSALTLLFALARLNEKRRGKKGSI
ncbi:MAG: hypothetical protein WC483_03550 [Candidatus Paceibacterota bacterium]